ncbi:MAG: hypothetical protein NC210_09505 [[Clostridium] fimetarium]|nr:hypothetical protein [Alistipes timonensis]MCM1406647.1 hypothetical protein [[Clostridium] fimetarium]
MIILLLFLDIVVVIVVWHAPRHAVAALRGVLRGKVTHFPQFTQQSVEKNPPFPLSYSDFAFREAPRRGGGYGSRRARRRPAGCSRVAFGLLSGGSRLALPYLSGSKIGKNRQKTRMGEKNAEKVAYLKRMA